MVTSRHGQQYQCNYPTHQEQKQQKEEEEKIALETGVVELLKPMSKGPCLLKVLAMSVEDIRGAARMNGAPRSVKELPFSLFPNCRQMLEDCKASIRACG